MCGGSNSPTAMTDNNGNLKKQEVDVPGSGGFAVEWFTYDSLNRLQAANETWHKIRTKAGVRPSILRFSRVNLRWQSAIQ
jgi:hypothetical protein